MARVQATCQGDILWFLESGQIPQAHLLRSYLGHWTNPVEHSSALRAHARARGWNRLRLLNVGDSTFKYDLGSEDRHGNQDSMISVFTRDRHGAGHHFYAAHPWMSPEIKERGIDLMSPIWHILDLTPQGRGDLYAKLEYPMKSHT